MHDASLTPAALVARRGLPAALADALVASRADMLATFALFERALPSLAVPLRAEINPPLWELGHIGWFQEYWIARNPERARGERADPDAPRRTALRPGADGLYDSTHVPHDSRWQLPLPNAAATREDLARQLDGTLALLARADASDAALYFFRLALLHEDMHHEAALYMARGLGVPVTDARWRAQPLPEPGAPLAFEARTWRLGSEAGAGFAFDNELPGHEVALPAFAIDRQAVRWAEFLPFVEAGGYEQPRWWTEAGARWRTTQPGPCMTQPTAQPTSQPTVQPIVQATSLPSVQPVQATAQPRYLQRTAAGWQQWQGGAWRTLDLREAASHLTLHEAEAWCRWAGRRLPTEAEWECAACSAPQAFRWGDVWEWTASAFAPFAGFVPHPYRAYSAPWFDGRPVLRGASHCTQPRMRHPRYRNFFPATRHDVPAGFRSCAL